MLLAKFLTKEFKLSNLEEEEEEKLPLQVDPTIPKSFIEWAASKQIRYIDKLLIEEGIFTPYELTRQVHLTFTLNLMSTYLSDFYNRNDFINRHLEEFADDFPKKDDVLTMIELAANKFLKLKIKKKSYWYNKANAFSVMCLFLKHWPVIEQIDDKIIKHKLEEFELKIPNDYQIAAKEGVNNKQERLKRNKYLIELILNS
jgi:hypothetical protein